MNTELLISLLTFGGTLLLVVTGLLNFSVFVRQLRAAREQLETARRQLESARQQPQIQLVQRAMSETSDHLRILIERPYLRPYFYENKPWEEGDKVSGDEVKAMAELFLNNFASAIIHSAAFPQYPVQGVEQTIRFHLRNSPALRDFLLEGFDRFPLAGLALLCLKNETKAEAEADLRGLISASEKDAREKARRERLLHHLQSSDEAEPLKLAKYSLERAGILPGEMCSSGIQAMSFPHIRRRETRLGIESHPILSNWPFPCLLRHIEAVREQPYQTIPFIVPRFPNQRDE